RSQSSTIELDHAFFVEKLECLTECNPEYYNPLVVRAHQAVSFEDLKKAVTVTGITGKPVVVKPEAKTAEDFRQTDSAYSLDELAYSVQPARKYLVRVDPSLV